MYGALYDHDQNRTEEISFRRTVSPVHFQRCRIYIKVHWSCSDGSWWLSLKILFFYLICQSYLWATIFFLFPFLSVPLNQKDMLWCYLQVHNYEYSWWDCAVVKALGYSLQRFRVQAPESCHCWVFKQSLYPSFCQGHCLLILCCDPTFLTSWNMWR